MRLHPTFRPLWLLPIVLAGCSSTVGSRFGGTPQSKSIAVVGDHPLPAASGEPGGRVVADDEIPEPRRNPKTRISGRVIDEAGEPVPGATVRLADSGLKGGKEIQGTTDRSGAFTLNGLRPQSTYVLIAEGEDEQGAVIGRAEAKTGKTGVEITLASAEKAAIRRTVRPSRARPISDREDVEADLDEAPKINREDVAPASNEPDPIDPGPPLPTRGGRPQLAPPEPGVGWKTGNNATASRSKDGDVEDDSPTLDSSPRRRRPVKADIPAEEEAEANPLPPALNRDGTDPTDDPPAAARKTSPRKISAKISPKPKEAGEIALAPEASLEESAKAPPKVKETAPVTPSIASDVQPAIDLPPELAALPSLGQTTIEVAATAKAGTILSDLPAFPPVGGESVVVAAHESPSLTPSPPGLATPTQVDATSKPAPQPVFASQGIAEKPTPAADYNPFANLPPDAAKSPQMAVTALAEVERGPIATEEAPKKKWGELVSAVPPTVVVQPTKANLTGSLFRRRKPPVEGKDAAVALCSYDSKLSKINDMRLPDLEGKPVKFQDFDSDFVLLDFWGTWCAPCLDAIPHLVELQKKYGPDKLKVVGIACEEIPPEQRKAKVDEVARKLGINYPVLLSTMDGKPCPVQQALHIQAMPTMILVDRSGKVLWRNTGSTTESEGRLDRILATSVARGDTVRR